MKQRLLKIIAYGFLAVSVVLTQTVTAFAEETETGGSLILENGDIIGDVIIEGVEQHYDLPTVADIGEYDYVGATSIHTQRSYGFLTYANTVGNLVYAHNAFSSFSVPIPVLYRMEVERGHTYSGQIFFYLHMDFPSLYKEASGSSFVYRALGLGDFEQQSLYEGVTVSYYGFVNFGERAESGTCDVTIVITFDNFQPTFSGTLNVNSMFEIEAQIQCTTNVPEYNTAIPTIVCTNSVSSDWAGELYDYPTSAIVDSDGTLIKNQTDQQQQIAQEQASQSAQQHDQVINGYDNSVEESQQAEFDSALSDFESQEQLLVGDAIGSVDAVDLDTSWIDRLSDTFALIRLVFMAIVTAMGDFQILITITLSICLALFAIGWFRR